MEKQIIYVATQGSYSDYRICAVFTDKALAEKYKNSLPDNWEGPRIEEYIANPHSKELNKNHKPYFLRMKKDGECVEIRIADSSYGFDGNNMGFDVRNNMYLNIFARDEKHAIKIANEKRAQLIAENKWNP